MIYSSSLESPTVGASLAITSGGMTSCSSTDSRAITQDAVCCAICSLSTARLYLQHLYIQLNIMVITKKMAIDNQTPDMVITDAMHLSVWSPRVHSG